MIATKTNRKGSATVTIVSDTDFVIERQFDAPARKVFKAYTTPELVKQWWGLDTSQFLVCDIDLRVGGTWRYVTKDEHEGQTLRDRLPRHLPGDRRADAHRPHRGLRGPAGQTRTTSRRSTSSTSSRRTASRP